MRLFFQFLLFLSACGLSAGETRMPWLGVKLVPAKELINPVSEGVGLQVQEVIPQGPLSIAGGEKGDLWWKMDDQILVNMRQLVVLLKMRKPGEVVTIELFRNGKALSYELQLSTRPPRSPLGGGLGGMPVFFNNKVPKKVEESAEMISRGLKFNLIDREGGLHLQVSKEGEMLYNAALTKVEKGERYEPEWSGAILILRQALSARAQSGFRNATRTRYKPRDPAKTN